MSADVLPRPQIRDRRGPARVLLHVGQYWLVAGAALMLWGLVAGESIGAAFQDVISTLAWGAPGVLVVSFGIGVFLGAARRPGWAFRLIILALFAVPVPLVWWVSRGNVEDTVVFVVVQAATALLAIRPYKRCFAG
jgi:hypothetical protein